MQRTQFQKLDPQINTNFDIEINNLHNVQIDKTNKVKFMHIIHKKYVIALYVFFKVNFNYWVVFT